MKSRTSFLTNFIEHPGLLCIGHMCHDKKSGSYILGGTASYASLMSAAFGINTAILTSVGDDFKFIHRFRESNISICSKMAAHTTVFENVYTEEGRTQYIHARAESLTFDDLPVSWQSVPLVKFCLIADEIETSFLDQFESSIVAGTIQGLLRTWDDSGKVSVKIFNWELLNALDLIFISRDDLLGFEIYENEIISNCKIVVITDGSNGALIHSEGQKWHLPSWKVKEVDPTGAGDIFATAFLIQYSKTNDIFQSTAFAHAAASIVVEHDGAAIPPVSKINERFENYMRRFL